MSSVNMSTQCVGCTEDFRGQAEVWGRSPVGDEAAVGLQ